MQSIAQQTNSCTGMKGWPNKRFVFNLAFLHFALSSPLHCVLSCVPRSGCNLSRSLHFTVPLMQKSNYWWYMTFAALQKWGRTLPTSPAFSCHIEVQFGCILILSNLDEIVDEKEEWKQALRWQWLTTRSSTCLPGQYDPRGEQVSKYFLRKKQH